MILNKNRKEKYMKKITFPILLLLLLMSLATLASCGGGGNGGGDSLILSSVSVDGGELKFVMSDGLTVNAGAFPQNAENISLTGAKLEDGELTVYFSDGYSKIFNNLPEFSSENKLIGADINDAGQLVLKTTGGDKNLGKIFYPTVPAEPLTPAGASVYATTRDVTGRNTATVEMDIKGYGKITLLLDATTAPVTVNNFIKLVKSGFYDGLTFHRLVYNFMIQGGDPEANGSGGSDTKIYGEFSANGYKNNDILHKRGTISMARSNEKNSASSQFFICSAEYTYGDGKYAAFGYVLNGMNIVDKITELGVVYTNSNGVVTDLSKQVVINSITVIEDLDPVEDDNENGENSGESGDSGSGENSGESGDSGNGENSGESGDSGNGENSGESGDSGNGENSGESGDSGSGENSGESGGSSFVDPDSDEGGWSNP